MYDFSLFVCDAYNNPIKKLFISGVVATADEVIKIISEIETKYRLQINLKYKKSSVLYHNDEYTKKDNFSDDAMDTTTSENIDDIKYDGDMKKIIDACIHHNKMFNLTDIT